MHISQKLALLFAAALACWAAGGGARAQFAAALPEQLAQYDASVRKTIVELQPFRQSQAVMHESGQPITLTNLNPNINVTLLLSVGADGFHLENPDPGNQDILLDDAPDIWVRDKTTGEVLRCGIWAERPSEISVARKSGLPFAPLCDNRLYMRNVVTGSRSNLERVTDFLRDHVWGGEDIVRVVRGGMNQDRHAESSDLIQGTAISCAILGPCPAMIEPAYAASAITPIGLGIALNDPDQKIMVSGAWYNVAGIEGVFVSAIQPRTISSQVLNSGGNANALDSVERKAVNYLIAFNIDRYSMGFALGTDHPRLDWSPRPSGPAVIARLPGPDGVGDEKPLVRSGMVSPDYTGRTIATLTAGFKRSHGAFKFGEFATTDTGKHYGFIEKGVIYSKLKTELATLFVLDDGTVDMKTWTEADNAFLHRIAYARQNGVPLVETDPESGAPVPGKLVNKWGPGNWSGSAKAELRTLRAGGCVQEFEGRRYFIYGYFSTATPSAMARTFQAYNCRYAMLLDMNALEHTYLALYPRREGQLHVEHLITGMAELDKPAGDGGIIPRFLGYPDNRDLFFLYKRTVKE